MSLSLPSNARFVYHENRCFDWGTFGWAIKSGIQDTSAYKYIIFMNSSVRGPFLPPYWPVSHPATCLTPPVRAIPRTTTALVWHCRHCRLAAQQRFVLPAGEHPLVQDPDVQAQQPSQASGQHHQLRGRLQRRGQVVDQAAGPSCPVLRGRNRPGDQLLQRSATASLPACCRGWIVLRRQLIC